MPHRTTTKIRRITIEMPESLAVVERYLRQPLLELIAHRALIRGERLTSDHQQPEPLPRRGARRRSH